MANKKNNKHTNNGFKPGIDTEPHKWIKHAILSIIAVFTYLIFSQSINSEFVNWDDPFYITDNPIIRDFSVKGFIKIFTTPVIGMYNPITFVYYTIIYKFWGLNPQAYNIFNIFLHIIAAITIFNFIFKLTKRYETAAIVALLFAIHPMHVAVVCWASQTKTSLYLIFYFIALKHYLNYLNNFKIRYLVYAALLFILSVMSKPSAVSLPVILFLLDYYLSRKIDKRMFIEKIPFFIIALFFGILTLVTHSDAGDSIFEGGQNYSLINNLLVSNYSIVFYFHKLFFPFNLSTIYPYPVPHPYLPLKYYFSVPVIPFLLWLIYKSGKFKKELIFGLLFFTFAIAVMIRIVPSGFFRAANRYTYLSYTGLFFIIGQYYCYILDNKFSYAKKVKGIVLSLLVFFILMSSVLTYQRSKVWQNSITLFDDVIKKHPHLVLAYNNRAVAKKDIGDYQGAIDDFTKSIELDSTYSPAYNNRGEVKRQLNDTLGALKDYNKALLINPKYVEAYNNRGIIMANLRNYTEALINYNMAIKLNPKNGASFHNRGLVRLALGDTLNAVSDWDQASKLGIQSAKQLKDMFTSANTIGM